MNTLTPFDRRRRQLLQGGTGGLLSWCLPQSVLADSADELHTLVAKQARKLAGEQQVKLRMLIPAGSGENLIPVIAAFRKASGIEVEIIESPVDDINTQLTLDSMSGDGTYDLALPATFGLPDLASSGAILPLDDFAARYEPADFRKDVLFSTGDSFDGELYGFQADGDAYLMFYHKGLLNDPDEQKRYEDQFGEALAIPDTWETLDQQMAWFHRPDKGLYGGVLFRNPGYLAWEWWVRFHAKGYWPLSATLEPQIDCDAGVEALEAMIRATSHQVPESRSLGLVDNWKRFSRGDVYCNIGWGGSQKYFNSSKSAMQGRLEYGPTPGGLVDDELLLTPYFNWGWNYVVTANSQQAELAYLFALYASSPHMSTLAVRQVGGFFDPIRPTHYDDEEIQKAYSKPFLDVHRQSLESAIPDLYLANQGQYYQTLGNWLDRAMAGQVEPAEALANVSQHWQLINRQSDMELQRERWLELREKYPENVRRRLRDLS
ncbi:extracellular solute-binding protein [Granulosicoccus antarcticus]|uniref:Uncharacterized protein n=1 Tax=Granulosicoccus antarcticus IMCC3135 TaxID=1192854 RepID=A0A2Z2P2B3_9GAMM|nr:extracellular solute-binding protein [Granulosicoccus antarcticus]ASJ76741.1 hypothetical protein IMCC3135_33485 [Granulosicoccus antarcticus IMCC3135]